MASVRRFFVGFFLLMLSQWTLPLVWAQPPVRLPKGQFLTDSIEIGRPFRYALTYRHTPSAEVLFPDTSLNFKPFRVKEVTVSPTETTGEGAKAISRDSAVYTLISFETDSVQLLQVPIRVLNLTDCTTLMSQLDTVFLRSRLTALRSGMATAQSLTLASETQLAPLQQQFNYPLLIEVVAAIGASITLLYLLFGRLARRQWHLFQLRQHHVRFLRDYNRLTRQLNASTVADIANQAVIRWKTYLEELENQPYASLTTPEIAERTGDDRVGDALREADRMIYGNAFSERSPDALRLLRDVAAQAYHRRRNLFQSSEAADAATLPDAANPTLS